MPNVFDQPVTKLLLTSQSVKQFAVQSLEGYQTFYGADFTVDEEGDVYRLFQARRSLTEDDSTNETLVNVIVKFDHDGSVDSTITLQNPPGGRLETTKFVAFDDGNLLVAGIFHPLQPGSPEQARGPQQPRLEIVQHAPPGVRPFTAVFDRHGSFMRELALPDDISPTPPAPVSGDTGKHRPMNAAPDSQRGGSQRQNNLKEPSSARHWVTGVFGTLVAPGPSDTAYLLRPTDPPLLYTLSSDGEVLHEVRVQAYPATRVRPVEMALAGQSSLLIVLYGITVDKQANAHPTTTLAIVDPATGKVTAAYLAPEGLFSGCATSPNDFEFLGSTKDRKLKVVKYAGQ